MIKYPVRATRRKKSLEKQRKKEEFKLRKRQIRDSLVSKYTNDGNSSVPQIAKQDLINDYRIAVWKLKKEFGYDRKR